MLIRGVRFRRFAPTVGLHPHVAPVDPLVIDVGTQRVSLHGWQPHGGAYDDVPRDRADAARRRGQRFTVATIPGNHYADLAPAPASALTRFTVDTRRFSPR